MLDRRYIPYLYDNHESHAFHDIDVTVPLVRSAWFEVVLLVGQMGVE